MSNSSKSPFSSFKPPFPPNLKEVSESLKDQAEKLFTPSESGADNASDKGTSNELSRSIQVLLQSALSKLDLVTREEFDAQRAVLQKTREKADQLEKQLNALIEASNEPSNK